MGSEFNRRIGGGEEERVGAVKARRVMATSKGRVMIAWEVGRTIVRGAEDPPL
jgi:hypothetical protein